MKKIVLISERMSDRLILLSKLWKKAGYKTCAIYCIDNAMFNDLSCIDFVLRAANPGEIIAIATKIDNKIIHYFNYGPDNLGAILIYMNIPYIYDYKDLFGTTQTNLKDEKIIELEKEIVKKSIAITRRDDQLLYFSQKNKIDLKNTLIKYIPECYETDSNYESRLIKVLTEKDYKKSPLSLVLTGGYAPEFDKNQILYEGIFHLISKIADQEIFVTIIGGYSNNQSLDNRYNSQIFNNKNILVKPALPSKEFDNELLNYDFAIHMFNNDFIAPTYSNQFIDVEHHRSCGSARIYPYIKACLPILIGKTVPFTKTTLGNSGFGISINSSDIENLSPLLTSFKNSNYRKKVYKHRELFSFESLQEKSFDFFLNIEKVFL